MARLPVIVVHGGAGSYTTVFSNSEERSIILRGVHEAARAGYKLLERGGTAVDAVEAAVSSMENSPLFNAGRGSYLTDQCTIEMDAAIMDGATLNTGAVACISNVRNPIQVARLVMDRTTHAIFCAEAARAFAEREGCEIVPTDQLITQKAIKRLQAVPEFTPSVKKEFYEKLAALKIDDSTATSEVGNEDVQDTVGAVAVDCNGNVAYATSTGGISGKRCGRVGDSPIVGSGGYADNRSAAISTTGHGEAFIKMCSAKHAAVLMEQGSCPQDAVKKAMDLMEERVHGVGGCIAVNCRGDIGIYMTSEGMAWVSIQNKHVQSGIFKGEVIELPSEAL